MGVPTQDYLASLAFLLQTGKYSDLTLVGETQRYQVHKAILCPRSDFFDGACSGHFIESQTGEIDMTDENEDLIEHMLSYFYNLDYLMDEEIPVRSKATYMRSSMNHNSKLDLSSIEDPLIAQAMTSGIRPPNAISTPIVSLPGKRSDSPRRQRSRANSRTTRPTTPPPFTNPYDYDFGDDDLIDNDLVTHARVYAVADKYGIPGLKALAQKKFETQTAARWDDYDFLDAMEEVYTTTAESDRGLRNVVVQAFRAHPHLARRPETREVIDEIIPLAQDLGRWRLTSFAPQWVR